MLPVLAAVHSVQIMLPYSAMIIMILLFLVGFVVIRIAIRIWDLVGV